MRVAIGLVLALAGCGQPLEGTAAGAAEPAKTVLQTEAEKACADMTGYASTSADGKTAGTEALIRREYETCVGAVASGDAPASDAPALRGRTSAP